MEITTPKRPKRSGVISSEAEEYPLYLQFYEAPPMEEISLQEFEEIAVERLKVLRIVESVGLKYAGRKIYEEYRNELCSKLRAQKLSDYCKKVPDSEVDSSIKRRDHLSHFILRLAFCQNDQHRNWFIEQEADLFRARYMCQSSVDRVAFLEKNNSPYEKITDTERKEILPIIKDLHLYIANDEFPIFKVYFTEVDHQLRKRRVYLQHGYAFIPFTEMDMIIMSIFRSKLSLGMAKMRRSLPLLEDDKRCFSILNSLPMLYTGKDYASSQATASSGKITADMVDLVACHFPPCMRSLHNTFKQSHHLRHFGRLQYGLFLKGIGLNLDDAIKYLKREYCKKYSEDDFSKQFLYNIRHSYGEEGKRANYTPYSCLKVIMGNMPGPGDAHGCPFRHWDRQELRKFLTESKVSSSSIQKMCNLIDSKHYDVACTAYFEAVHGQPPEQTICHPNQYFEESRKFVERKQTIT